MQNHSRSVLTACAMIAPLLHCASGSSWPAVLAVGGLCTALCCGLDRLAGEVPAWYAWLRWGWGAAAVSTFLRWSGSCWQTGGMWIPIILLLLSAWTVTKKEDVPSRAAAVLGLIPLAVGGAVLLCAIKEIKPENLLPAWQVKSGGLIAAFLLPALSPQKEGSKSKFLILCITAVVSAVTVGVLGIQNSWDVSAPFYELSKSLTLLGAVKRFESLAAVAMAVGFYLTGSFILKRSAVRNCAGSVWLETGIAVAFLLLKVCFDDIFLAAGCSLIWVILPTCICGVNKIKKTEKSY